MLFVRNTTNLGRAALLVVALLLSGCFGSSKESVQLFAGRALGTSYNVRFVGTESQSVGIQSGVEALLDDINQSMSTYLPRSELNRLNDYSESDWYDVSSELAEVLRISQKISLQSSGAFDITVGPLVDIWGFGPEARREIVPEEQELQAIFNQIGFKALEVDPVLNRIRKNAPRQLDLSAVAKGYAVDKIADYLNSEGIKNFLVEVGGEMRLQGLKPGQETWKIAIETPDSGARGVYKVVPLTDAAIATSGDYRNYFEIDGVRYSHTLDPSTGYPITHGLASITVITESCAEADAWATALNVLGTEKALQLAEANNLAILLIEKSENEFIEFTSSAYDRLFSQ